LAIEQQISGLSWLYLDRADLQRAQVYISSLDEPGQLDPLGLGVLRDSFADSLFPGVTTLHRRVKYVFFLLERYEDAIHQKKQRFSRDELERDLRRQLLASIHNDEGVPDSTGVVGNSMKGEKLPAVRPSEIYSSFIDTLGVLKDSAYMHQWGWENLGRLRQIQKALTRLNTLEMRSSDPDDQDSVEAGNIRDMLEGVFDEVREILYDGRKMGKDWWETWKLRRKEARFLSDKYAHFDKSNTAGDILFKEMIELDKKDWPSDDWGLDSFLALFPNNENLRGAIQFSRLAAGIYKVYSLHLIEKFGEKFHKEIGHLVTEQRTLVSLDEINQWAQDYRAAYPDELNSVVTKRANAAYAANRLPNDFLLKFHEHTIKSPGTLFEAMKQMVFDRELHYKGPMHSKHNGSMLVIPVNDFIHDRAYHYEFRWPNARQHILDIRSGLQSA